MKDSEKHTALHGYCRSIKSHDKPVSGHFEIQDALEIDSGAWPIDITISFKASDFETPAKLRLESTSGPISVKFLPLSSSPSLETRSGRGLDTKIKSTTGSITACLPHLYSTCLQTRDHDITAELYPHGPTAEPSKIELNSNGQTKMTLYPHLVNSRILLKNLSTTCTGLKKGSVQLIYPLTWQGRMHVHTPKGGQTQINWPGMTRFDHGIFCGEHETGGWVGPGMQTSSHAGEIRVGGSDSRIKNVEIVAKDLAGQMPLSWWKAAKALAGPG